tara:strand:- start:139 stop:294 length:156 start_codon:yes stop_codon:yes gene_type:complete
VLFDRRRRPGIPSDGGGYSPEEFEAVLVFDMVVVVLVLVVVVVVPKTHNKF